MAKNEEIDEQLVEFASQLTKTMAEAQTIGQGFIDENLAFPALDTKRDAAEWVEAMAKLAAGAWLIGLKSAMLMTRSTSMFVGGVLEEADKHLDEVRTNSRRWFGRY